MTESKTLDLLNLKRPGKDPGDDGGDDSSDDLGL